MEKPAARLVCWGRPVWEGPGRETRKSSQGAAAGIDSGAAKEAHGEAEAEKRLKRALDYLGLTSQDLKDLPRAAAQKAVIAWWLRERTTVSLRWVSERLGMGHYTRVSQAISRMKHRSARKHDKLRRHLSRLE